MTIYTVQPGDTVDTIAAAYGIAANTIIYNNQLSYPYRLAVGQALLLSAGESPQERRIVHTGGYAYPFIRRFTLTPFGEDGMFNNTLISIVVNDAQIQQTLINNLVETVNQKGFEGVDIDFEYILAEDRTAFAEFVANVHTAINNIGYPVSVALAPKTSDEQAGLLYGGKDYRLLGEAADYVLLMTYEWGYTFGPPRAVAPINEVRKVVEYALTRIPAEKINLGIPNYGYDWPLPYERGVTKARTISNTEAIEIAIANNAVIQFDETAMSPYFTYVEDGISHEVWFEDARSLREKFSLIEQYNLRGPVYWQLMNLFRANWLLLADTFYISSD